MTLEVYTTDERAREVIEGFRGFNVDIQEPLGGETSKGFFSLDEVYKFIKECSCFSGPKCYFFERRDCKTGADYRLIVR
jgi:hypothetical protein